MSDDPETLHAAAATSPRRKSRVASPAAAYETASAGTSFEKAFAALESTVTRLEAGNLSLEEAVSLYEQGLRLAEECGKQLDSAELRISKLSTGPGKVVTEAPFEEGQ